MLDFGWPELLIILVITIFVVGPEDIPKVMVGLGRLFRRFQYIKFAMSKQFEDIMRDSDLDDIRKSVNFEDKDINHEEFNEAEADEEYLEEILQSEGPKEGDDDSTSTS